ncbi:glycosyltransferase [Marinobacter nanhaiticus D15-8W]|uniref:Glycosyltransferase family 1 protein n=1 Tax=Marinobacter nanhaiticus D15-8W TaxID=626887 RepID=N6WZT7_9GAMM|nr:glycosyltransferase family 4 protein [Marinobacter nanhaiticus]ENO14293.1 glycosyltransferase family 1 protein [Marinobacter nanhaiticus D15-8W]BES71680.1 glycosyltransferase [Marinobacter nanhaiticus D15-8W]
MPGIREKQTVVTHIISGDLWAGAEAQVYQLISGLRANREVIPTAVVFNPGILYDKLQGLGIEVTVANEATLSPWRQILTISDHLKKQNTDIVHTHGFKENVLGTLAQHLARVPRSLRTAHGNPETTLSWKQPAKKLTQILDDCIARFGQDAIVAVSRQLEASLSGKYPRKTVRISNFIDLESSASAGSRIPSPKTPGSSDRTPACRIAMIGRAVPVKRIDLFIDTIALLRQTHEIDVIGVIYGDGPLLSSMKEYAALKAPDAIEFKGFVSNVPQELTGADVLLMPSDHEGLPMSLLEAVSIGIPVVAHNTGGIPEVLDGGACGILVTDHSPTGYASAIAGLISDEEFLSAISAKARQYVEREFSANQNIRKYQELYERLSSREKVQLTPIENSTNSDSI